MATLPFLAADALDILDAPEPVLSTMAADGRRRWMYPQESHGRYLRRRRVVAWALVVLFALLPVVRVGGRPAVLLDVAARAFTFFGTTFYPTDTVLLLLLALTVGVGVLLFTALYGRVWCGWACPQTVYLEFVFRPIERLVEGDEHVRKRRDEGPWTAEKAGRKALKWALFLGVAAVLAHVFVSYFAGWDRLLRWMTRDPREHPGYFLLMAGTTALVAFDFGVFREQMCTLACPYARLQSVLLDADSLLVAYDETRGEPRGRGKQREALGACVDCFACVRTCPVGIDIRDGLQMECIACTQCIDACDAIMDRTGQPRGLIRYASEHEIDGEPTRRLRGRTALYGLLFAGLLTAFVAAVATRDPYAVTVGRSVGAPYVAMPDGAVANRLVFRVRNQRPAPTAFTVEPLAPAGLRVRVIGRTPVPVGAGALARVEAFVLAPPAALAGGQAEGRFRVRFADGTVREEAFALLGPK